MSLKFRLPVALADAFLAFLGAFTKSTLLHVLRPQHLSASTAALSSPPHPLSPDHLLGP